MTTRRAKREKKTSDNISWPRNVIYSHFLAKKCYHVTFLGQEMLSASGVGDHISSSRNCDTDNGYKLQSSCSVRCRQHRLMWRPKWEFDGFEWIRSFPNLRPRYPAGGGGLVGVRFTSRSNPWGGGEFWGRSNLRSKEYQVPIACALQTLHCKAKMTHISDWSCSLADLVLSGGVVLLQKMCSCRGFLSENRVRTQFSQRKPVHEHIVSKNRVVGGKFL